MWGRGTDDCFVGSLPRLTAVRWGVAFPEHHAAQPLGGGRYSVGGTTAEAPGPSWANVIGIEHVSRRPLSCVSLCDRALHQSRRGGPFPKRVRVLREICRATEDRQTSFYSELTLADPCKQSDGRPNACEDDRGIDEPSRRPVLANCVATLLYPTHIFFRGVGHVWEDYRNRDNLLQYCDEYHLG